MSFRMPPQILRLVLLAGGIVGSYAVAHVILTPTTFGQYGHYRGAALEEIAARNPTFAGAKACDECHDEVAARLAKFEHRRISCESCHGPTSTHAGNPDVNPAKVPNATCLRCHEANVARPVWLRQVKPDHFAGDRCVECHVPHQPKETP